jgi:hypothetical protein
LEKTYAYKKSLKVTAWIASTGLVVIILSAFITRTSRNIDVATLLFLILLLSVPFSALATVNTIIEVTNDSLARRSPFGTKSIEWTNVTKVFEKEGFFQQVVILVDNKGRKMTVPYEQLEGGKDLYTQVKEMLPELSGEGAGA